MKHIWVLQILLLCCLSITGCTLVGLGVGQIVDYSTRQYYAEKQINNLESGDKIRVLRNDSSWVEGIYETTVLLDTSTYALMYSEFKSQFQQSINLPAIGDTLLIFMDHRIITVVFHGFGWNALSVEMPPSCELTIFPYEYVHRLERQDSTTIDHESLIKLNNANVLPLNGSLILKSKVGVYHIALNDIKYLEQYRNGTNNSKLIGAGIGLVVDIAILIIISQPGTLWNGQL